MEEKMKKIKVKIKKKSPTKFFKVYSGLFPLISG
jgi:hypothetical protein